MYPPPTHTHMPLVESNRPATPPTPTHCPATHTHTHLHSGCVVVRCVGRDHCGCVYVCVCVWIDWFVRVGACLCVGVYPLVRGCVCGCVGVGVRFGTGLCAYVVGWPPHPHTHQHTDARPHVETNRKSRIHPHANPTIQPYTNPHKPTHPTQRHTHTHVHMLPVARVPAGVFGGKVPRVLGQMRGCTRVKLV